MNTAPTHSPAAPASPLTPAGDDPNEQPYPGYARELAALQAKRLAAIRAAAAPLPGPLREAFAGTLPQVHGFTLHPVVLGLHPVLVELESPMLDMIRIIREEQAREDGADISTPDAELMATQIRLGRAMTRIAAEVKADDVAVVESVYAFTRPIAEIRALLQTGRENYRETAMVTIADTLHPVQFAELQKAVSAHYSASFATAIHYTTPARPGDNSVFTKPPARKATGWAGGCTWWARWRGIFQWVWRKS